MPVWHVGSAESRPRKRVVFDVVYAREPCTFKKEYQSATTFANILKAGILDID